ncbi:unnamed protein product [Effrenium voratum]|nr:unnamed protein product [Effrenium voratum]
MWRQAAIGRATGVDARFAAASHWEFIDAGGRREDLPIRQFCFRCKVSSWHRGVTCNERLRCEKARQAQLCPGCGVPTQRSEGCRKITCVCGRVWEWEGGEGDSSDEERAPSPRIRGRRMTSSRRRRP